MASAYQTSSHYSVTQSHPAAPSVQERPNLPSLKDLNFTYNSPQSQDGPPPQNGPGQSEHAPPPPAHSVRHDTASWVRAAPSGSQPPSHHGQVMPPPPQKPSKSSKQQAYRTEGYTRLEQASHKPNGAWAAPPQAYAPQPPQPVAGGSQSGAAQQAPLKHGRTEPTVSASPGRSPHVSTLLCCRVCAGTRCMTLVFSAASIFDVRVATTCAVAVVPGAGRRRAST